MEPTNITRFGNLERAMSLRWSLTLLSTYAFIDLYTLIRFGMGIAEMSTAWVSSNVGISEVSVLILTFSVTFAIVIPGASFLITTLLGLWFLRIRLYFQMRDGNSLHQTAHEVRNSPSFIEAEDYRRWAVLRSNSAAYRDYERAVAEKNDIKFMRYMCRCLFLLSILPLLVSETVGLEGESYLQVFFKYLEAKEWFVEFPIKLGFGCFVVFLIGIGFSDESHYDEYIHLRNHNIENE